MSATRALVAKSEVVDGLAAEFGERLRSVVLYGSVPRQESILGVSDVNLLVLLDRVTLDDLRRLSSIARRCVDLGRAAPMLFGWDEFRQSTDAFAIEMADLQDGREIVYGQDPVVDLVVPREALRHQLEHEIRARHAQLREGLMLAAPIPAAVGELLEHGLPAFVCYLRSILRLAGREVPSTSEDVIRAAANLVDARPDAFLDVWGARRAGFVPEIDIEDPLVEAYIELVERSIVWVDQTGIDATKG
ncbi:MAG: hypothetical protein M8860_01545 [marine benthic group bacterium]|nr:hypothetical protein [Gemmatimonadota bacterium]MCL7961517.1 hypothetical protein [Candidatus Carthagonibacter metallireducens]MCL7964861.1 hypothetical protein [Gemmatimonadota bacterium]MCL7970064.1 hypothetical protein [Gemmatimonadota bacterium]MCL7977920.1 hypothetical protein [Gemmatimonadota bacterium]